jgi:hypothetical protein
MDSPLYADLIGYCEARRDPVIATLSEVAARIAKACGFKTLFAVTAAFGGTEVFFPTRFQHDCVFSTRLAGQVPGEHLAWIIGNLGPGYVSIPALSSLPQDHPERCGIPRSRARNRGPA